MRLGEISQVVIADKEERIAPRIALWGSPALSWEEKLSRTTSEAGRKPSGCGVLNPGCPLLHSRDCKRDHENNLSTNGKIYCCSATLKNFYQNMKSSDGYKCTGK